MLYQFNLEGNLIETLSTVPDYHEYNDIFSKMGTIQRYKALIYWTWRCNQK
ncbi:hypothetical protein HXA32_05940 [Salipaludibacillus agaradhaerens]|uniref:hypothetical protein n=1 Tax=Salipaludibacillus agaradhaerens TaxID=76935 RepID=UPI002150C6AE|nr:hypothetical protein [Salipaludibacillus agaradhaerens]MCR6105817.1 hypothetical protein [Salipaludibacillus agaradhaerens]